MRLHEETVESLLQKLRNEEFQQIAKQLLRKKGIRQHAAENGGGSILAEVLQF